jgi:hypothetical protein
MMRVTMTLDLRLGGGVALTGDEPLPTAPTLSIINRRERFGNFCGDFMPDYEKLPARRAVK